MKLDSKMDLKRIEGTSRARLNEAKSAHTLRPDSEQIAIIEGPPTMNGDPHIGHVRGRVIKDMWYRYKTLQGFDVRYSAGWDTQGLPVELQAQKELGIEGSKSKITPDRIGELVAKCKQIVESYNEHWVEVDSLLGMSVDCDSAYWTYHDSFIEREWQVLLRAQELGVLQDNYTVIAYCPQCQTSLSHTEVAQGYKETRDPSLYYKVKLQDDESYLVVWTTMPFTLVTDALIGVHPDELYCRIKTGSQTWIVGKTRLAEFAKETDIEYSVISELKGAELDGLKYVHPLLGNIPELGRLASAKNYHCVVSEDFVDTNAGSGLVHISPANGEEDIRVAQKRNVRVFNPIDDEVKFTDDAGKYARVFVRDADKTIIDDLRECGALVRAAQIRHQYPHCWRSGDALVWLARRGWFYMLDGIGKLTLEAASSVEYYYEQTRNRFLGIVSENHPWCISRERFWGTPLPVWTCESCSKKTWLYSRREIINAASELPDGEDFELHTPWIDKITIRCSSCNSTKTRREQYVLDTWHNSGSAPHSSLDDASYERLLPVPFLSEGIDQTRGWAYTMLVENVILCGRPAPPYSSFLFQGHVLDHNGDKMSKTRGNVVDAHEILSRLPVDLVRFYFMWKSSPIEALSFDESELTKRPYQVLATLYNLHTYFEQNSLYDKFDPATTSLESCIDSDLFSQADYWILSRLQQVIDKVTTYMDTCHIHEAARQLEDYVINDLSQTYIPMTRSELWEDDASKISRRHAVYAVIRHILCTVNTLLHPFCPFTTDHLHATVFANTDTLFSTKWPILDKKLVNEPLEKSFDLIAKLVSTSNAARSIAKLKRRWPLDTATLIVGVGQKALVDSVSDILCTQLNIEKINVIESDASLVGLERVAALQALMLPITPSVSLDRKACGPKARELLAKLVSAFERTDPKQITDELSRAGSFTVKLAERDITLDQQDIVIRTSSSSDDNAVIDRDGIGVIMPVTRSSDMVCKGLIRDLARRLQALRKERNHNPTDILEFASVTGLDSEQTLMLNKRLDEIAFLVRVRRVELFETPQAAYTDGDIDGQPIRIAVG